MTGVRFPDVKSDFYPMGGGLDLVTPAIRLPAGKCYDAQNYEPDAAAGYRRINGYERFDGQTAPTDATYYVISITLTGAIAVGNTVTGGTSGATGKVLGLFDTNTTLVLGRVVGTFQSGETLTVAAAAQATTTSLAVVDGAPLPADHAAYKLLAADDRRADILVVPGSGNIRGGFIYGDICYAFRDNAGGTAGDLYKQTASGWSKVAFGKEIQFTGAVGEITAGQTITGLTSAATALVVRPMLRSGTWTAAGAGTLIVSTVVGTFQNGEALQVGGVTKVTSSSLCTNIARAVGGHVEWVEANFTGATSTKRIYGCDGVNLAFEFDGTNYIPIRTGMTTDTPSHIASHKSHLFLSFDGSLQYSGINAPYSWTALTGAAELPMGDTITGLVPQSGSSSGAALAVFTKGRTSILYGSGSSDFSLTPSVNELGYAAYTVQSVGNNTYGLTARGIQSLVTTLNYGDFQYAAVSFFVQPLLATKLGLQTASVSLKTKNQYRLFFSDNTALVVGLNGDKITGILPLDYGIPVLCVWSGKLSTGEEVTFFGSSDGYVYQDNVGTSFDGDAIESWIRPVFNNLKSPMVRKQFRAAVFEVTCEGYASVNVTYDLGYGSGTSTAVQQDQALVGDGGFWDQFTWDSFTWDSPVVSTAKLSIDGAETNIGFLFYSNSAQDDPHTVSGVSLLYTPRKLVRSGS